MTSIVDFINSQKDAKQYDYIYAGKNRDYYLNIISILCDINIFYYLDNIDYNIEKDNVIIIFDQTITEYDKEEPTFSLENIIEKIRNKHISFFSDKIKFICKDLKSNIFKNGIYTVSYNSLEEDKTSDDIEKEIEVSEDNLSIVKEDDMKTFHLYEFEIIDKISIPLLSF
jgi:hypothetical protein